MNKTQPEPSSVSNLSNDKGIDKIDARILRVLQRDGRISNLKLAEEVHLSPTAVLERVKRLTRENFILGYEARLNPNKLGAGMMVFIEVLLDRTAPDVMDTFKAAVQTRPEILECHVVTGEADFLLKVVAADLHTFSSFLLERLAQDFESVTTRSEVSLEEIKSTTVLPLV